MTPDVVQVWAFPDYKLRIKFENGELKVFDMKPYLDYQIFADLKSENLFMRASIAHGTVVWSDEIDISPDTLYFKGETL